MNHTERFNQIMDRNKPTKKIKQIAMKIEPRENMNELQTSLSKCTIQGDTLFLPPIHDGILPNYQEVRKALINAGATYKQNKFIFPNDAKPYIDRLMGGESVNIKKEFQFFGTPAKLADYLVELAEIKPNDTILEPSAGQGAIISAIYRANHNFDSMVYYYELMDVNRNVLTNVVYTGVTHKCIGFDFLESDKLNFFDKIIANPPFSKNQDINHILKMFEALKPKGRIVTIASKHWQHSSNKKETAFKQWLKDLNATVIEVEAGEFAESGTKIATCIIIINKP